MTKYLGEFEQLVLLAILRLGDEAYGMAISRELDEQAGREVSRGALYLTLDRMTRKGYLQSRLGDSTPARGGRAKRFFKLTSVGEDLLRSSGRAFFSMWSGVESLLEER